MKKLLLLALAAPTLVFGQWGTLKSRGKVEDGNIPIFKGPSTVEDGGVGVADLALSTNVVKKAVDNDLSDGSITNAAEIATNEGKKLSTAEQTASKNQPNGYLGLDENGEVDADYVETIVVVFAGNTAVDD